MDQRIRKTIYVSMLSALCCVATIVIPIPTPTGGYLNAGDVIVMLAALLAGPFYGGLAAGLGSGLADLLAGYTIYAPGSLVVKWLAAAAAGRIYRKHRKVLPAVICGEAAMVAGYFLYESVVLGLGWAAGAEIGANTLQGIVGAVGGAALYQALIRVPEIREIRDWIQTK